MATAGLIRSITTCYSNAFIQAKLYMPPVTALCMFSPEIQAGARAGDAGCEEEDLGAHLPARCVWRQWGERSALHFPSTVKSKRFQNIAMQTEHKAFNANSTKCSCGCPVQAPKRARKCCLPPWMGIYMICTLLWQ